MVILYFPGGLRAIKLECGSNVIFVPHITAGSVNLPGWPVRETVRPWKIIRGQYKIQ